MDLEQAEAQLIEINIAQDGWELALDNWIESLTEDQIEPLMPAMFRFFETNSDEDIWALTHVIEDFYPHYKLVLLDSLAHKPSANACKLVNRILNSKLDKTERLEYTKALQNVLLHPDASAIAIEQAKGYLEFQQSKE